MLKATKFNMPFGELPNFIFQLLSIISQPFGSSLQQTPLQKYKISIHNLHNNLEVGTHSNNILF